MTAARGDHPALAGDDGRHGYAAFPAALPAPPAGTAVGSAAERSPRMTAGHAEAGRPAGARTGARPAAGVLADRLAAALVHHEPGWRLPRHTALARRYNVSAAEIDAALEELASRHLIRKLADGQLYRASPAEYLIPLEGVAGLGSFIDPMGAELACRSRQVSWRRVPEDIGWALGVTGSEPVCVVRFLWTADGEPAALSTTYLAGGLAGQLIGQGNPGGAAPVSLLPLAALAQPGTVSAKSGAAESGAAESGAAGSGRAEPGPDSGAAGSVSAASGAAGSGRAEPGAAEFDPAEFDPAEFDPAEFVPAGRASSLHIEMQQPPPAVARSLQLSVGQPAAIVTVRFDDPEGVRPVALTVAVLRPDLFRIVVQSALSPLPGGENGSFPGAWTHAMEDLEA